MALATTISNTLIEGNTFSSGYTSANGISASASEYTRLISNSCDAQIIDNTFNGQASNASNPMATITDCSCFISNNKFIRGTKSISAYIVNSGTNDHVIIDNVFDNRTTDGSTETLVSGLTNTSIYDRNKNQTGTEHIKIRGSGNDPYLNFTTTTNFPLMYGENYGGSNQQQGYELLVAQAIGGVAERQCKIKFNVNLDQYLPKRARILNVLFSFYGASYMELISVIDSTFSMKLCRTVTHNINFSSPTGSFADIAANIADAGLVPGETVTSNIITTTYPTIYDSQTGYLSISLTDADTNNFVTGAGYSNSVYIELDLRAQGNSYTTQLYHGLFVKYKYV